VGSPERIKNAAKLMIDMPVAQKMVVVSAMGTPGKGIPKVRTRCRRRATRALRRAVAGRPRPAPHAFGGLLWRGSAPHAARARARARQQAAPLRRAEAAAPSVC